MREMYDFTVPPIGQGIEANEGYEYDSLEEKVKMACLLMILLVNSNPHFIFMQYR